MTDEQDLRDRVPDHVPEDVTLFESGGDIYGRDDHGEFRINPMTGAAEPQDGRCGAVCKYTMQRYGETRYCTAMPESTFVDDGSDYCKLHKSMDALMEQAEELFKHGYFTVNYINFAQHLSPTKFLFAVEMVDGLFQMSEHEFDVTTVERTIDTSESPLISEDSIVIDLPMPQDSTLSLQANELWTAALKEVMTQNMQEAVFAEGVAAKTIATSADMEGQITDVKYEKEEHHLHLPISRLAKDIKEHLQNGGVTLEDDEGAAVTFQKNDYTLDVSPEETDSDGTQADSANAGDVAADFTRHLEEDDAEPIEIEN